MLQCKRRTAGVDPNVKYVSRCNAKQMFSFQVAGFVMLKTHLLLEKNFQLLNGELHTKYITRKSERCNRIIHKFQELHQGD